MPPVLKLQETVHHGKAITFHLRVLCSRTQSLLGMHGAAAPWPVALERHKPTASLLRPSMRSPVHPGHRAYCWHPSVTALLLADFAQEGGRAQAETHTTPARQNHLFTVSSQDVFTPQQPSVSKMLQSLWRFGHTYRL